MKGSDLAKSLPASCGDEREAAILEAVRRGDFVPPEWSVLELSYRGHTGRAMVAVDALKLGEPGDCFRVNVNATTAQRIADALRCVLPTTRIADECYRQANVHVEPRLQPAAPADRKAKGFSPSMDDTEAMLRHDRDVSELVAGAAGLICNVGKHWVLSNRLLTLEKDHGIERCCNYGWFTKAGPYRTASGILCWQPMGGKHNRLHVDYSQTLQLVRQDMEVDGKSVSIYEVGSNPELAGLISDEGVVKVWRQPGAPGGGEPAPASLPEPLPEGARLTFSRTLLLGRSGDDVALWQRFLRVAVTGVFNQATDGATRQFQGSHRDPRDGKALLIDGRVGPATLRAANADLVGRDRREADGVGKLITSSVRARNYTNVDRSTDISLIVIHTAETAEVLTAAEALGAWVSGPNAPQASWHFATDADSTVQCLPEELIAWHAPGANRTGIGIEMAGRAKQSSLEWRDEFSTATLERTAALVAYLSKKWKVPLVFVDAAGLLRGERGVTTHWEVTKAFKKSTHTDPGQNFPMDWFLQRTKDELGAVP